MSGTLRVDVKIQRSGSGDIRKLGAKLIVEGASDIPKVAPGPVDCRRRSRNIGPGRPVYGRLQGHSPLEPSASPNRLHRVTIILVKVDLVRENIGRYGRCGPNVLLSRVSHF